MLYALSKVRVCISFQHCPIVDHDETESRADLNSTYQSLLRTYINSPSNAPPPEALVHLLSSPRIRLVDLSHLEETHGTTLLHEAAKRKDLRMVELAVRAGADVFVRDRKGRMAGDGQGKDDRVKAFLRQCTCASAVSHKPSTHILEHKPSGAISLRHISVFIEISAHFWRFCRSLLAE